MPVSRSSELVGKVVGGRYRLLRPVGSGASANVYVAEDVRLKRRVALKVLHPGLADDRSFLRRFEMEAQVVAAMRHPGIVRVYDWGEGDGDAYLAMELLDGGSLRALLDTGYHLSVSQAAALGTDVASALAHAHARGLVHRDIKPANLLFDEDGHASVADFGIARALAEASWTEPMGALVGTARYAAPEQLEGVALDGKADVYALCLVLVEAVTGSVPFAADTTLGALLARSSKPVPVPDQLGALAPVLRAVGVPEPGRRPSAEQLAERLAVAARSLRAPARLPVAGLGGGAEVYSSDRTEIPGVPKANGSGLSVLAGDIEVVTGEREPAGGTGTAGGTVNGAQDADLTAPAVPPAFIAPPGGKTVDAAAQKLEHPESVAPSPQAVLGVLAEAPGVAGAPTPAHKRRGRRKRGRKLAVALVVLLLLGGAGAGAVVYLTQPPPTYPVPAVAGMTVPSASHLVAGRHLHLVVASYRWDASVPAGRIVVEYPLPGVRLRAKKTVSVTVSKGPEPVAVPSLAGRDLPGARSALTALGLALGHIGRQSSMSVPAGEIISWAPKGVSLLPGKAVNVVVSTGKPMVQVPGSAPGEPYSELAGQLAELRLGSAETRVYSNSVLAGNVISVSPAPGTTHVVGTVVTATVSQGPHLVTIPSSIIGLAPTQAAGVLYHLGLYVSATQGSPLSAVTGSVPAVGQRVLYGKSIILLTG
ncbi:MAG TPA: protein kinase [Acidimicrobiales bacterium]|nr:protein kinase [Acidimicrobiales bacterium]